jgi:uncharacterized iron-regulated protein
MKGADFTGKCRALALGALLVAGCAHDAPRTLEGRIWDVRGAAFVRADEMYRRAARATHVILGETHDNPEQHRFQRLALERLPGPRALAMEQFDSEYQAAIDAAQARGGDAEAIADAGHFDRKGWNWPLYEPLVRFALEHRWRIVAANLSRAEARAIVRDPARSGLPPAPALAAELSRDIVDSHCGRSPPPALVAGMVEAQRARDAHIASRLEGRTVLITGNGHARRDRGVPLYLPGADIVSIGLVEADAEKRSPADYLSGLYSPASFDYVWFTARAAREDPCG